MPKKIQRSFVSKPSAKYLETVQALRELLEAEGSDTVTRVFAEATWEHRRAEFTEKNGLQPARDSHVCLHRLKGESCPDASRKRKQAMAEHCQSPMCIPGFDHGAEFKKDGQTWVIVSQPYHLSYARLEEIVAFCAAHGLEASFSTWPSWHFPGAVLTVEYKRAAEAELQPEE